MRNFFVTLFTFTKHERKGISQLFIAWIILLLAVAALSFYNPLEKNNEVVFKRADSLLRDSIFKHEQKPFYKNHTQNNYYKNDSSFSYKKHEYKKFERQLFNFDPNTANTETWKKLGLYDNQVKTILKYTGKGGHFYKPEDVLKIKVVKPEVWQELIPYIIIEKKSDAPKPFDTVAYKVQKEEKLKQLREQMQFEINSCTKWNLIKLGLADSITCSKIIAYRKTLGGFTNLNQMYETKDIDTNNISKMMHHLTLDKTIIRTLNINYINTFDLSKHPYINYNTAVAIINYRNQHGKFQKLGDLKNCAAVSNELFKKIEPYLVLINN